MNNSIRKDNPETNIRRDGASADIRSTKTNISTRVCSKCGEPLELSIRGQIKCPKCGTLNTVSK